MKPTDIIEAIIRHADSGTADLTEKNEADNLKEISLVKKNINSNKYIESKYGGRLEDILINLMVEYGIPERHELEFRRRLISCAKEFYNSVVDDGLPPRPVREYQPREGIIEYLKAPDGLGPWLEAGVLTRPMVKEFSPSAYNALAYWLRDKSNSLEAEGIILPSKSEVVARRTHDPLVLKEAWRISREQSRANARIRRRERSPQSA